MTVFMITQQRPAGTQNAIPAVRALAGGKTRERNGSSEDCERTDHKKDQDDYSNPMVDHPSGSGRTSRFVG
jgi:hypothetical protein